jgi:hypothetical protein
MVHSDAGRQSSFRMTSREGEQARDQAAGAARVRRTTDGWLLNLPD